MTKLKPCPFCGSKPTLQIFKGKDGWRDRYSVLCRYDEGGCGAEGGLYHSEIEAVEAWNRRSEGVTNDLISRQAAIDAIWDGINMDIYTKEVKEILEDLPTAQSEIIRCKDCKHKPYRSVGRNEKTFICCPPPNDEICPFLCDDPCYDKVPPDDFFCAYGEAKDD